uniref:Putative reverse transcriptase-rnase h-integrase n=1 Tax=Moniliophthora roreri TaxID=221103 RepID=A0A0W0G173_MONRR
MGLMVDSSAFCTIEHVIPNAAEAILSQPHLSHPPKLPCWEKCLQESFKIAVTPSKNCLEIPIELQCTESGVLRATSGFVDCGATDKFIDKDYAKSNRFVLHPLICPIPVYNVNGSPNCLGTIPEMADVVLKYKDHTERTMFAVTSLGKQTVLLGYSWLEKHNPEINWQTKEEARLHHAEAHHAHKWNAQLWPTFTEDLDSEDCALSDDEDDSDMDRDPSVGADALEEEDCIFACNLCPTPPAHHINATSTVSQWLAEAAAKDHQAKSSVRDNLPKQFWGGLDSHDLNYIIHDDVSRRCENYDISKRQGAKMRN